MPSGSSPPEADNVGPARASEWVPTLYALDVEVAEALSWAGECRAGLLTDGEIVARLFALNQERAAAGR